jgi:hypothetical protein
MDQRYRDHLLQNLTDFEQKNETEGFVRFGVTGKKAKRPNYQIESKSRRIKYTYFGHKRDPRTWKDENITSGAFNRESLTKDSTWDFIHDLILKKDSLGKGESIAYEDESAQTEDELAQIKSVVNSTDLSETEKDSIIKSRRGQGKFRKLLIEKWKGCSVTQFKEVSLLRASHIKPWSDSNNQERLDPYNGFLLTPNLDVCFDKYFITFNANNGAIIISDRLKKMGIATKLSITDR